MTWDVPVKENCPVCGWTMFKKSGRGAKKAFCINEQCSNFTPEEKRGGWKKKETEEKTENTQQAEPVSDGKKTVSKKATTKKAATKKETTKKTTTKKSGTTKTTTRKKSEGTSSEQE